jgi:hypothetical protein
MKKVMLFLFLSFLTQMTAVTVDGHVYLEGETDHSGIKVILQRVAPDTLYSYTVYSDASGYYFQTVEQGIYTLKYEKLRFERITLEDINLYSNYTVPETTLAFNNEIWGHFSGKLERGSYLVSETLIVDQGHSLLLDPGVILEFYSNSELVINGLIKAQGAEGDSIRFTSSLGSKWLGMRFNGGASDNSVLNYCIIENSSDSGIYLFLCSLKISNSSLRRNNKNAVYFYSYGETNLADIKNCEFINNNTLTGFTYNSVIYCAQNGAFLKISDCDFNNNYSYYGLINISSTDNALIENSSFTDNDINSLGLIYSAGSKNTVIRNCFIANNYVSNYCGGVYNNSGKTIIENSVITNNSASSSGGVFSSGDITVSKCAITNNTSRGAGSNGGGVILSGGKALIENSIVSGNTATYGAGISSQCDATIVNSVISKNNGQGIYTSQSMKLYNNIISNNSSHGIRNVYSTTEHQIINNDFYSNGTANFYQCNEYLGVNVTTNANGDPCDPWYNITLDPKFTNSAGGDFTITGDSPCIDAGVNEIEGYDSSITDFFGYYRYWDGDGNGSEIVDIGFYEYGSFDTNVTNNINGTAELEGESDHSGIQIKFDMTDPVSDLEFYCLTDASGYYSIDIPQGTYKISFENDHYFSTTLENIICTGDMSLSDIILDAKNKLQGPLSGFLPKDVYAVIGNISVQTGNDLEIEAGAVLEFDPGTEFVISGILKASGTKQDSVRFVPLSERTWEGIYFNTTADNSVLNHSVITGSNTCGIYNNGADIVISDSRFSGNKSAGMGGAMVIKNDSSIIRNCEITNNGNVAVYVYGSNSRFSNCRIAYNGAGGIIVGGSGSIIEGCFIYSNDGYGISASSDILIVNSVIHGNTGDGITASASLRLVNSASCYNFTGFKNSSSSIIPQNISYSCFSGNANNNFLNCASGIGTVSTTNSNGDQCDQYYNIMLNPKFSDGPNGVFTLLSDSPCIDAGNNYVVSYEFPLLDNNNAARIWDGDGNGSVLIDIGGYEYGSPVGIEDQVVEVQNFVLYQNYPNPFNPVTTISYALPEAAQVELNVYNLQGQLVQSLVNGRLDKGVHKAEFNSADITSGMYIYSLKVDGKSVQSKKMMLLK